MNQVTVRLVEKYSVKEVVVEAPKKLVLKKSVKNVLLAGVIALGLGTVGAVVMDKATTSESELAQQVKWVAYDAHKGDGYERIIRRANGNKELDIKAMSDLMQQHNHGKDLKAYHSYEVPVLEAK